MIFKGSYQIQVATDFSNFPNVKPCMEMVILMVLFCLICSRSNVCLLDS